jgi:putative superfamily III holin-X
LSTTQLVSRVAEELSRLARAEFQLARMRLQRNGKRAGLGAGTMGGAGALAAYGGGCLIAAAIVALAMAMQAWAAALVVGVALLVGAALAGVVHEASGLARRYRAQLAAGVVTALMAAVAMQLRGRRPR